jgi:hypothetical protein
MKGQQKEDEGSQQKLRPISRGGGWGFVQMVKMDSI